MLAVLRHMEHQGIRIVNAPPGMEAAVDLGVEERVHHRLRPRARRVAVQHPAAGAWTAGAGGGEQRDADRRRQGRGLCERA